MRLLLHPDSRCTAVAEIEAEGKRDANGALSLSYAVSGDIGALLIPPPNAPVRTDELWRHTCFEAFVRAGAGAGYREINLSPSSQWAAYAFGDYRAGMVAAKLARAPAITIEVSDDRLELAAVLAFADLPAAAPWRLALSAVIEEKSGAKSYWALAHPRGAPDFHHPDSFACELTATERP